MFVNPRRKLTYMVFSSNSPGRSALLGGIHGPAMEKKRGRGVKT